ncbi:MAG: hypothetical protein KatS3mg110_3523 [Pirellulaceae bacterium]|nr:MAG: hypothetical protein KatS3mg110_3523 [Pirellulaceae bacterium]
MSRNREMTFCLTFRIDRVKWVVTRGRYIPVVFGKGSGCSNHRLAERQPFLIPFYGIATGSSWSDHQLDGLSALAHRRLRASLLILFVR